MRIPSARGVAARASALGLALLLVVAGAALPASADDAPVDGLPVTSTPAPEETTPPADAAPETDEPTAEPTEAPTETDAPVETDAPEVVEEVAPTGVAASRMSTLTVADGNVDGGSASWSISELMGRAVTGFASPRGASYVAPATFTAGTPGVSTWGAASGSVDADGSASIAFGGSSVNHASTGGGWLRIADPEAQLDADGNGVLTAVVSYGTSTPPSNYDATQAPLRGPVRVNVVVLTGNTAAQATIGTDSATWTGLTGSWDAQFLAFVTGAEIPGVSAATTGWTYASNITGATATSGGSNGLTRTPAPLSLSVALVPPAPPVVFDDGAASWSISELMGRAVTGFASPRGASYVAPATFTAGTPGVSTWGAGSGTVAADGSASLSFEGTSVNHASTGGGWLRIADVQAELDADGNGVVSAVVSYGTSTPPSNYDATQAPLRGPVRVNVVALSGNTSAKASLGTDTATWTGLTGSWDAQFVAFVTGAEIPGVSAATTGWTYASNITGATATSGGSNGLTRTPSAISFALAHQPEPPAPTVFDDGSVAWSISELMGRSVTGFASPRGASYVAPATFTAGTPGVSTWGGGSGTVQADGSASLAFQGTSVNHASTGGGWLRIADVQAELDADGNGVVTAVVSYGTSTPPSNYDAAQTPLRGPVRVNVVALTGNTSAKAAIDEDSATWTGLTGSWDAQFLAFVTGAEIPGVSAATTGWTYASNITGATATSGGSNGLTRTPAPLTFSLAPQPEPIVFDEGSVAWSISELMGRAVTGFASPRGASYVAPATFTAGTPGVSTWAGGSGSVEADGSASLAFGGTSVNHASTGGGWLRIADPRAELDADGNGVLTAVVSYGTSTPPSNYDATQAPLRGPVRVNVVALSGNTSAQAVIEEDSATWTGLTGSWDAQFVAFITGAEIPGVSAATTGWTYASNITGATATSGGSNGLTRTPAPLTLSLGHAAPPAVTPVVTLGATPAGGAVAGTTVVLTSTVTPAADGSVQFRSGSTVLGTVPVTAAHGTAVLNVSNLAVGAQSLVAVFTPTDAVRFTTASSTAVSFEVTAPLPTPAPGTLSWGVKSSFREYILGPIAHGTVTTSGGAGLVSTGYWFPQSGVSISDGLGTVSYRGTVAFSGHGGDLAVRLADPVVRVTSSSSAVLSVVTASGRVDFANLNLSAGSRTVATDGAVTYGAVPATLTAAGAAGFAGFYSAGEVLDPVSFTIGSNNSSSGLASTRAATASTTNIPAATPPATEGVESEQTEFTEGGSATFTAEGFQPNETGILAVIYSEPTLLADDLTADANGAIAWTGTLPAGLSGQHTFTFQGSVDRGIVIEIAAAEQVGCVVDGAVLDWGFKESFRAYIDGSIANGEWTTADGATYATPLFTWANGTGGYDAETGDADLAFTGSVRFTGHEGVLDTTIANPRVVIDGDRAVLLLDVSGTTQSGEAVSSTGVEFVELDLAAAEESADGDVVAWTGIPATLTSAGAAVFGTYEAGEAFDTLDLSVTPGAACAETATDVEEPEAAPVTENASDSSPVLWIVLGVVLVLVLAAVAFLLVRRARRTV